MADDPLEKGILIHQSEGPGLSVLDCDFGWSKLNDEQKEAMLKSGRISSVQGKDSQVIDRIGQICQVLLSRPTSDTLIAITAQCLSYEEATSNEQAIVSKLFIELCAVKMSVSKGVAVDECALFSATSLLKSFSSSVLSILWQSFTFQAIHHSGLPLIPAISVSNMVKYFSGSLDQCAAYFDPTLMDERAHYMLADFMIRIIDSTLLCYLLTAFTSDTTEPTQALQIDFLLETCSKAHKIVIRFMRLMDEANRGQFLTHIVFRMQASGLGFISLSKASNTRSPKDLQHEFYAMVSLLQLHSHLTPDEVQEHRIPLLAAMKRWRDNLPPNLKDIFTSQKYSLHWARNAPHLFLPLLIHIDSTNEEWEVVFQDETTFLLSLQPKYGLRTLLLKEVERRLLSSNIDEQVSMQRTIAKFLLHQPPDMDDVLLEVEHAVVNCIFQRWTNGDNLRDKRNTDARDSLRHLHKIVSVAPASTTAVATAAADLAMLMTGNGPPRAMTTFVFFEDFETSCFLLLLCYARRCQRTGIDSFQWMEHLQSSNGPSDAEGKTSDDLEAKLTTLIEVTAICLRLRGRVSVCAAASTTGHCVQLLRTFAMTNGCWKFCMYQLNQTNIAQIACPSNVVPFLQWLQATAFTAAHCLRSYGYESIATGSGSGSGGDGILDSVLNGCQWIYDDAVARSVLEMPNADEKLRSLEDVMRHSTVSCGVDLPMSFTHSFFERSLEQLSTARGHVMQLTPSVQPSDFDPDKPIYNDHWWELSLLSLAVTCASFQSSVQSLYIDSSAKDEAVSSVESRSAAQIDRPWDLLQSVYKGYRDWMVRKQQAELTKAISLVRKIKLEKRRGMDGKASFPYSSRLRPELAVSAMEMSMSILEIGSKPNFNVEEIHKSQIDSNRDTKLKQGRGNRKYDHDDDDESEGGGRKGQGSWQRALSAPTSTRQISDNHLAKQLASKLTAHPYESAMLEQVHLLAVATRPQLPSVAVDQRASNSSSLTWTVQDMLWMVQVEWLGLLHVLIKATTNASSSLTPVIQDSRNETAISFQQMVLEISVELLQATTTGVSKAVFENTIELLFLLSRGLQAQHQECHRTTLWRTSFLDVPQLHAHHNIQASNLSDPQAGGLGSRVLSVLLIVLQAMGASADQKLLRALLNLLMELSGDDVGWAVISPLLLRSSVHALYRAFEREELRARQVRRRDHLVLSDDDDDDDIDGDDVGNEQHELDAEGIAGVLSHDSADTKAHLLRRSHQVQDTDKYLRQAMDILRRQQLEEDYLSMTEPMDVDVQSTQFNIDNSATSIRLMSKSAEVLFQEILRRLFYDLKAVSQNVQTVLQQLKQLESEESSSPSTQNHLYAQYEGDFIHASHQAKYLSQSLFQVYALVFGAPQPSSRTTISSDAGLSTTTWDTLPWKCQTLVCSLIGKHLQVLTLDSRNVFKAQSSTRHSASAVLPVVSYHQLPTPLVQSDAASKFVGSSSSDDLTPWFKASRVPFLYTFAVSCTNESLGGGVDSSAGDVLLLLRYYCHQRREQLSDKLRSKTPTGTVKSVQQTKKLSAKVYNARGDDDDEESSDEDEKDTQVDIFEHIKNRSKKRSKGTDSQKSSRKSSPTKLSASGRKTAIATNSAQVVIWQTQKRKFDEIAQRFAQWDVELQLILTAFEALPDTSSPELECLQESVNGLLQRTAALLPMEFQGDMDNDDGVLFNSPSQRKRAAMLAKLGEDQGESNLSSDLFQSGKKRRRSAASKQTFSRAGRSTSSKASSKVRSRNKVIDAWLCDEDGDDAYADLEDFLV